MSLVCGLAIVAGAVFLRGKSEVIADTNLEDPRNFVAALPLREYQEPTDTDGDGLRDWLEELTGTDPEVNDAARIASSTASSAPFVVDTETERFAISFFEEMMNQHGGNGLSPEETQAVLAKSLREFTSLNKDTLYFRKDIEIIQTDSPDSIRQYGNEVGSIILKYGANPQKLEPELVILGRALEKDDEAMLGDLTIIRSGYDAMQRDLLLTKVPSLLIDHHLLLLNAITAVRDDIAAFEQTFKDPLVSFLRLKRYESDVRALAESVERTRKLMEEYNIVYRRDEPGNFFFSLRP